jgi:branched-chain amino acid transport system substrate-binding protein
MRTTIKLGATAVAAALALTACSSSSDSASDGASGGAAAGDTLVISSDLPLQGAAADANESTNNMMKLYLEQIGNKVGDFNIEFKAYDDSTAAKGSWDDATCAKNAQDHVANTNEVAIMGTYNTGCAKIIVPVLNQDPNGPMLMVSHANTGVGLTKADPTDPGSPEKYYPKGGKSYARVATTDDVLGASAAQFAAQKLGVKRCFVINDNQTYGQGVAGFFAEEAKKQGIEILGNEPWDAKQPNYTAFFEQIKAKNPDCLYIGGIFDNNGGQLIKDKIKVLGDNDTVKMMGPDGFSGYPGLQAAPEAEGMYLTFAGLDQTTLIEQGGAGAELTNAYEEKYGSPPPTSYALYGVAALQVILDAIEKSDGTRKGITDAVFSGEGIKIPAEKSVLGTEIVIDPATGDKAGADVTVLKMTGGKEVKETLWQLK